jgi:hypothetical protein
MPWWCAGGHRRFEAAFFGYFLCRGKESNCRPAQGQRVKSESASRMQAKTSEKQRKRIADASENQRQPANASKNQTHELNLNFPSFRPIAASQET